jgi:hypothetical protein
MTPSAGNPPGGKHSPNQSAARKIIWFARAAAQLAEALPTKTRSIGSECARPEYPARRKQGIPAAQDQPRPRLKS